MLTPPIWRRLENDKVALLRLSSLYKGVRVRVSHGTLSFDFVNGCDRWRCRSYTDAVTNVIALLFIILGNEEVLVNN